MAPNWSRAARHHPARDANAVHVRLHGRRPRRAWHLSPTNINFIQKPFSPGTSRRKCATSWTAASSTYMSRSASDEKSRGPRSSVWHSCCGQRSSRRTGIAGVASAGLVSTWTLTSVERGVSGEKPERIQNPRGLLIFDCRRPCVRVCHHREPPATGDASSGSAWDVQCLQRLLGWLSR